MLAEAEALRQRDLAKANIMGLAAREVLERRAPHGRRQRDQVGLHAVVQVDSGLLVAGGVDRCDERQRGEGAYDGGRVVGGGQDIEVADRLAAAPQAAGVGRLIEARHGGAQGLDQALGSAQRVDQQRPAVAPLGGGDTL